jgi:hypothetical protein
MSNTAATSALSVLALAGCAAWSSEAPAARAPAWPFHSRFGQVSLLLEDNDQLPKTWAIDVQISTEHGTTLEEPAIVRLKAGGRQLAERTLEQTTSRYVDYDDFETQLPHLGPGIYDLEIAVGSAVHHSPRRARIARVACGGMHETVAVLDAGTRIVQHALQLERWRALDEPTDWIIEWVHDGRVVARTEDPHQPFTEHEVPETARGVRNEIAPFKPTSCWAPFAFGKETYALPEAVRHTAGAWEAHVFHSGTAPISVAFELDAAGDGIPSDPDAWNGGSARLATRPLTSEEAAAGLARLAERARARPPVTDGTPHPYAPEVPWSPALTRAALRSPAVVKTLIAFLDANAVPGGSIIWDDDDPEISPETRWRMRQAMQASIDRDARRDEAAARRKVPLLRQRLLALVARYGGPWHADEWPSE